MNARLSKISMGMGMGMGMGFGGGMPEPQMSHPTGNKRT